MEMCIVCFHLTMKSLVNLCDLLLYNVVVEVCNITPCPWYGFYCTLDNTCYAVTNHCRDELIIIITINIAIIHHYTTITFCTTLPVNAKNSQKEIFGDVGVLYDNKLY